jgi:hypothetical protein
MNSMGIAAKEFNKNDASVTICDGESTNGAGETKYFRDFFARPDTHESAESRIIIPYQ